ncbi:T9SS type A sorting domain-containing protein [Crocinitomix catalasitica]|uniref:T9SS type A sorting domain-containing protein n=1 Tax=Crocinitomix catalasitica TaxID=184607 RepID=UPI0009FF8FC3|nr:T9SS type A sorting domain-containing protein [Crocinitomix catalasitica]
MKKLILLFSLSLLCSAMLFGQCLPDRHSSTWFDAWISCETSDNPNELRGPSHWIEYDFNQIRYLNELKIWNINDPEMVSYGAQNIMIDYSEDGYNWQEYGQVVLPMAPGKNTYEGDEILNFDNLRAKKLLITILDNYGGECSGFAELKIDIDTTKVDDDNICISADIFPNPFKNETNVILKEKCLGDVLIGIEDIVGQVVREETVINLYETMTINTKDLKSGVYFISFRSGDFITRYKVVKN